MKKNKFSIIVPAYNAEDSIKGCVESIVNQSYKEWELIIVNDGSKDKTELICRNIQGDSEKINLINQINSGPGLARKKGVMHASGDYILFVDADDWIDNDMLYTLNTILNTNKVDLLITEYTTFDYFVDNNNDNKLIKIDKEQAMFELLNHSIYDWMLHGKVYKRDLIRKDCFKYNIFFRIGEDAFFNWMTFKKAENIFYSDLSKYHYTLGDNTLSHEKIISRKSVLYNIEFFKHFKQIIYDSKKISYKHYRLAITIYFNMLVVLGRKILKNNKEEEFCHYIKFLNLLMRKYLYYIFIATTNMSLRIRLGMLYFSFSKKCRRIFRRLI